MMKRLIAVVLAVILCFGLLCGCDKQDTADTDTEVTSAFDYDAAFAKYDPNTVVMTINGTEVTWSEFYYMLYSGVYQLTYYLGDMEWDQECVEGYGTTFEEYSMQLAMDSLKQFHAIDKKAAEMGVELSESDLASIEATEATFKAQSVGADASEEDFNAFLLKTFFMTEDVYRFINESSVLYEKMFLEVVGEAGEKMTEQDIADFVERAPYVTAKHIFLRTVDDSGVPFEDEVIASAKATAEKMLAQLQTIPSQSARIERFDELMNEYSEDEGLMLFPEGYTFTTGQMYQVFEDAAFALEDYEISGIVESESGFHIIMRIPTERSYPVDFDYENYIYYTVETYAATDIYSRLITSWIEEAEVVWMDEFKNITCEAIFS